MTRPTPMRSACSSTAGLWDLFDGDRDRLNIAHECVDRYASGDRIALRVAHADGTDETIRFAELAGLVIAFRALAWGSRASARVIVWPSCWNLRCRSMRRCSAR